MPCPLFDDGRNARCHAVAGGVVPSLHERERYCRTDLPDQCPTLIEYARAGQLTEERYYSIWIAPVSPPLAVRPTAPAEELASAGIACTL